MKSIAGSGVTALQIKGPDHGQASAYRFLGASLAWIMCVLSRSARPGCILVAGLLSRGLFLNGLVLG